MVPTQISICLLIIELLRDHNGTKFLKKLKSKIFQKQFSKKIFQKQKPRGIKCQPKANNNRFAVVVCARHVVKRPSKRMLASIYIYITSLGARS